MRSPSKSRRLADLGKNGRNRPNSAHPGSNVVNVDPAPGNKYFRCVSTSSEFRPRSPLSLAEPYQNLRPESYPSWSVRQLCSNTAQSVIQVASWLFRPKRARCRSPCGQLYTETRIVLYSDMPSPPKLRWHRAGAPATQPGVYLVGPKPLSVAIPKFARRSKGAAGKRSRDVPEVAPLQHASWPTQAPESRIVQLQGVTAVETPPPQHHRLRWSCSADPPPPSLVLFRLCGNRFHATVCACHAQHSRNIPWAHTLQGNPTGAC